MSLAKKIGLFACTDVVTGNMMGSGIALLPASLASTGGAAIWGWTVSIIGAMSLAYVCAQLVTKNLQQGDSIAYTGEISPTLDFQTSTLYYHTSWTGNSAIGITAVSYLSTFSPVLNSPVPAGIVCIVIVWTFIFVNMLGGVWVSHLATIGLVLMFIPVAMTTVVDRHWPDIATCQANWNTSNATDSHAVIKSILLCLWVSIDVGSAAVSAGMAKNPKRIVSLATVLGTVMAGIVYIAVTQVIVGMYLASRMAASDTPSATSASTTLGGWAAPMASASIAFTCLTSPGSWMMLVGQAGARTTNDDDFPKVYGEVDNSGIPKKDLLLAAVEMTALMMLITLMNSVNGKALDLFGELTGIVILLAILPYFYSCVDLIRFEDINTRNFIGLICSISDYVFCFIALMGASPFGLAGAFTVGPIILMFYGHKMHQRQNGTTDNNSPTNAH